jgi:hypothetical protein
MRALILALAAVAILSAAAPFHRLPSEYSRDPILQGPEAAEAKTGAPARTIAGIRFTESSGLPAPIHALPSVRGSYGIDERYHEERARLYGEYDPEDPWEAAYLTARLHLDARRALGDEALAIAAHLQGITGVRRDGPALWYVERVRRGR